MLPCRVKQLTSSKLDCHACTSYVLAGFTLCLSRAAQEVHQEDNCPICVQEALRRQNLAAEAVLRAEFKEKEKRLEERYNNLLRGVDQQIQEAEGLTGGDPCCNRCRQQVCSDERNPSDTCCEVRLTCLASAAAACDGAQPTGSGYPDELANTDSPLLPRQLLDHVSKTGQPIFSPAAACQAATCDSATPCGATDDSQPSSHITACPGAEVITPQNVDQPPPTTLCQLQRSKPRCCLLFLCPEVTVW